MGAMSERSADMPRVACDAMCGGLARWLRLFGLDTTYTRDIKDAELVRHAVAESRTVISSDHKLFERRVFTTGALVGLQLPVGLRLREQVRFAADRLKLRPGFQRCTVCNGELDAVSRAEVGDVVPARSLIWAREFYRCERCGHVFWEGTHWRRIGPERALLKRQPTADKWVSEDDRQPWA
jgi:uncharacterized protein with PIN domain